MKTINVIFIIIFFLGDLSAQKEDFIWVLGNRSGPVYSTKMDFNTQPVSLSGINGGVPRFLKTCTAISSANGELLFYTNGLHLFDRRHQIMENGDTLHPTDYTLDVIDTYDGTEGMSIKQNVRILPWPDSSYLYFILHHSVPYDLWKLKDFDLLYSVVDMSKNNGFGKVIEKNQHVLTDTLAEGRLSACRHANGRDWWILVRKIQTTPGYHRYLLNPSGLHYRGFQNIGRRLEHEYQIGGQSSFSPDGSSYASLALTAKLDSTGNVILDSNNHAPFFYLIDLYNFDRCTGSLSEFESLEVPYEQSEQNCYGISFSPNNRLLYVSSCHNIYQFDLDTQNIQESRKIVKKVDYFDPDCQNVELLFSNMQLAPNGKIYIAGRDYCKLSEIRYPDKKGVACGVVPHALEMVTWNRWGIPDFPFFRLGPKDGSACDTLDIKRPPEARFRDDQAGDQSSYTIRCTDISWYQPTDWQWTFGDGQTSGLQHPDHTYADTGVYEVCLTVTNEDGQDTHCDTVIVEDESTGFNNPSSQKLNINIFPNPSRQVITINGLNGESRLLIYNSSGRIIDKVQYKKTPVRYELNNMEPGLYWIYSNGQTAKFIKQ